MHSQSSDKMLDTIRNITEMKWEMCVEVSIIDHQQIKLGVAIFDYDLAIGTKRYILPFL